MESLNFSLVELQLIHAKLDKLAEKLQDLQQVQNDKIFLDTEELCITMHVSKKTLQLWRDNRIIAYSSIGRKYYYKLVDVLELLSRNYVPSK